MSLKDDKIDPPPSQRDQDDLARFELSSHPSMRKEQEPINVDYDDSDDDSDVIVIDTTPAMLAEKISADGDDLQGTQEQPRARKRQRTEGTDNETEERPMPFAEEDNDNHLAAAETINNQESKSYYYSVFEGCNPSEPIEIDDDSDDEIDDSSCDVGEGKSNSTMTENPITEKNKPDSPETDHCKSSVKSRKCTMDSAKTVRETGSDSVMDKKEENQNIQKDDKNMKKGGTVNLSSSKVCTSDKKADSTAINDSATDTGVSNDNFQNSDSSVVAEEDAAVSRPPFEVINLADDDDDDHDDDGDDDDNDSITSVKEVSPLTEQKRHTRTDDPVRQKASGTCQTRNLAIEIIDVDELDDMDCEVEDKKDYLRNGAVDTRAEGNGNKSYSKPRFKPNRNTGGRIGQKEWNTVRTFRSILPNEKGQGRKKAASKYGIYNAFPPSSRSSTENRFVFHPSNVRPEDHHRNTFLGMNLEDAHKEQERLLQKAAERVRNQPAFHVTNQSIQSKKVARAVSFPTMVRDVHLQHPDHFKYPDFYARLGLPRRATEAMVKSQYRRLARVYHPDRNIGKSDTKHKFQAVTEAYNHLMNTT
mmetsp:Transcript_607/g.1441  ORF Transcript_607/g.1441 Transcript_607/m.1441 type:complete len:588 (-) Transcript_607:75-1838(-)